MNAALKKALANLNTIKMFSDDGWKSVNEKCGHLQGRNDVSCIDLADGFTEFIIIWADDNGLENEGNEIVESDYYRILLDRWVDYLQND